jgi:outer membrane lipoprotein-sorting protein
MMRIRFLLIFIAAAALLAGCSGGGQDSSGRVREHYAVLEEAVYNVTLRTDFGDRVLDFGVEYTHRQDGSGRIKVISPELIAGIEAEISSGGAELVYDGMTLNLGALPGTGLSPMESLPYIINQWAGGYVTQTGSEKRAGRSLISVTTRRTEGSEVLETRTWFDADTLAPVTSELYVNGFMTVSAFFGDGA